MRERSTNVSSIEDARRRRASGLASHAAPRTVRRPDDDAAPYAAPANVADVLAPLVDNDGNGFVGIKLPPRDCAGWMLTPEQGEHLAALLLREVRRVRGEDDDPGDQDPT